jgi:type II secretory pathway pseudopilin PulG
LGQTAPSHEVFCLMPPISRSTQPTVSARTYQLQTPRRRRAFTITELLVAIGIIVLLIGILLPALSKALANAKRSQTSSTLQEFAKAIESFQQEFGFYPGLVPEETLASDPRISSTENALLHLMGGAVAEDDPAYASFTSGWTEYTIGSGGNSFKFKVNGFEIGKGPRIAGKQYAPFFAPKSDEFGNTTGQVGGVDGSSSPLVDLPDVLDAWGQPVLYFRAIREVGPMVGAVGTSRFNLASNAPYVRASALGDLGKSQEASLINPLSGVTPNPEETLAQFIRNPGFGASNLPQTGTARGKFALISAGADGVYFSKFDGFGTASKPWIDVVSTVNQPGSGNDPGKGNPGGPAALDKYDDVRVFGGG